jgi:molybdopterin converting factor subunit 1
MLFAGLAERFDTTQMLIEIDTNEITAGSFIEYLATQYPAHAQLIKQCFIAKNQSYATNEEPLFEQDELALIPPVSGGQGPLEPKEEEQEPLFEITSTPLNTEQILAKVNHSNHGASIAFVGTTREYTGDKRTVWLEYEGYTPMAIKSLEQIATEIQARWPGTRCAISHRIGRVEIGEASVIIAVSSPHREGCYLASRYAIERLKQIVPIWKKEIWADGSEWKGHQLGPWNPMTLSNDVEL